MTSRGTMALVCLCVLSACLLAMTQASSSRRPASADHTPLADDPLECGDSSPLWINDTANTEARETPFQAPRDFRTPEFDPPPIVAPSTPGPRPLLADAGDTAALREVIRNAMPHATPSDVDVWVRKWRGMPLNQVRAMLEMRRLVPIRPRITAPLPFASQPLPVPNSPRLAPVPTTDGARLDPSLAALRKAREIILNNIANASTPGFKRCRVIFGEAERAGSVSDIESRESRVESRESGGKDESGGQGSEVGGRKRIPEWKPLTPHHSPLTSRSGVEIAVIQRDWSPGPLIETGRQLDHALSVAGFFIVRRGNQRAYTRNGNFEREADGSLVVAADRRWRVVTIAEPASAAGKPQNKLTFSVAVRTASAQQRGQQRALQIPILPGALAPFAQAGMQVEIKSRKPKRSALDANPPPQLVTFANPDGLQPLGHGLFTATASSGPAKIAASRGRDNGIRSGCLESSNVDTKRELAELRTLTAQIQALRTAAEMIHDNAPPPGPIAEKPGPRRMSDASPHVRPESTEWFNQFFNSEKVRELYRNLGFDDPAVESPPAPQRRDRTHGRVTPASFEELESWEFPVEIEIL